jgi:UDP-N-acetylglucosamine--N-acetylmuramyl-(pentapeptide) pyrophosphoryl-undecaprenol N-acetylglucosamine transferase
MRITVAAGGTGGHIYPALAVVRRLSATRADVAVEWVGGHRGLERELVPGAGLPLTLLALRSLRTVDLSVATLLDPLRLLASVPQALLALRRLRPDVIYLTGGYVAIPVLLAAAVLRIPTLLWEGNRLAGRSVRASARLATLRAVTFAGTREQLPGPSFVTGTPIRELGDRDRSAARARLGLPPAGHVVLVFGGSQASRRLNTAVSEAIADLVTRCTVLHITGADAIDAAEADRAALPDDRRDRYRPIAFLEQDMDAALAAADLLVGRAGSSTIAEAAAYGLPLVAVPYPHAAAHQRANAAQAVEAGAALLVADDEFDGAALASAVGLLDDPRIEDMRAASRALARPGAAEATVQLLEALAERAALPSPAGVEALTREAA